MDDTAHKVEDIARVVAPQIGVVDNARIGVRGDGIAFHALFNRRFPVHDILVGRHRDILNLDGTVEENCPFVIL